MQQPHRRQYKWARRGGKRCDIPRVDTSHFRTNGLWWDQGVNRSRKGARVGQSADFSSRNGSIVASWVGGRDRRTIGRHSKQQACWPGTGER